MKRLKGIVIHKILGLGVMQRYVLGRFLLTLFICLFAATTLFFVFDTFERTRIFIRNDATFFDSALYMLYKIPLIVHLMVPVSVLVATLISLGRLSQLSEITAMRACGASISFVAKPLLLAGVVLSVLMFFLGETLVPWATERGEEIYHIDIKKKDQKGDFSRENFWYRKGKCFYSVGYYDSRSQTLKGLRMLELDDDFKVILRLDAEQAVWHESPFVGWTLNNAVEVRPTSNGSFYSTHFARLPLVISETPEDFYDLKRKPETMGYFALRDYVHKLSSEGIPSVRYAVDLASKISFPLVTVIVMLAAIPFALVTARSGSFTFSFIAGVCTGFGYFLIHAVSTSLGAGELLPTLPAAWNANIILGCVGAYLLSRAEYA